MGWPGSGRSGRRGRRVRVVWIVRIVFIFVGLLDRAAVELSTAAALLLCGLRSSIVLHAFGEAVGEGVGIGIIQADRGAGRALGEDVMAAGVAVVGEGIGIARGATAFGASGLAGLLALDFLEGILKGEKIGIDPAAEGGQGVCFGVVALLDGVGGGTQIGTALPVDEPGDRFTVVVVGIWLDGKGIGLDIGGDGVAGLGVGALDGEMVVHGLVPHWW